MLLTKPAVVIAVALVPRHQLQNRPPLERAACERVGGVSLRQIHGRGQLLLGGQSAAADVDAHRILLLLLLLRRRRSSCSRISGSALSHGRDREPQGRHCKRPLSTPPPACQMSRLWSPPSPPPSPERNTPPPAPPAEILLCSDSPRVWLLWECALNAEGGGVLA
jgi:hypothetical protein